MGGGNWRDGRKKWTESGRFEIQGNVLVVVCHGLTSWVVSLSLCLVSFRPWVGSSTYVSSTLRSYPSSILVSLDLKLVRRYRMIIETGTRSSPMKDSESRMSHHNHTPNLIPKFLKRCTVREPCLRQRIIYELFTTDDNNDDNSNNHY